jgi:hypothetical protein
MEFQINNNTKQFGELFLTIYKIVQVYIYNNKIIKIIINKYNDKICQYEKKGNSLKLFN